MLPIRCPQCGQINQPDDIGFPRCGQCHADLVRCADCRHLEGGACVHTQHYGRFTPDLEAAKHCPGFASRYALRGPRMAWTIPAAAWVPLLLLVVMLGLAASAFFLDPAGRFISGNPLRLEAVVQQQAYVGQPFEVDLRIINMFPQASSHIYLEFPQEFLDEADPNEPFPKPYQVSRFRDRLLLEYEPLPGGGQRTIRFLFTPHHRGTIQFVARLYAPSNQLRHEVKAPIEVLTPTGPAIGQKEGHSNERRR